MAKNQPYKDGLRVGRTWTHSHLPGGPWAYDTLTRQIRALWLEGFRKGVAVNHPTLARS